MWLFLPSTLSPIRGPLLPTPVWRLREQWAFGRLRLSDLAEYHAWLHARARCHSRSNPDFADYGGRGITMCREWQLDFWSFFDHIGHRPSGRSLDRINNDAGYAPGNVRWADPSEQRLNQRPRRKWDCLLPTA